LILFKNSQRYSQSKCTFGFNDTGDEETIGVVDICRKFTAVSTTLAVSHHSRNRHWLQPTTGEVTLPPASKYEKTSL
jgi:hypothetical protein